MCAAAKDGPLIKQNAKCYENYLSISGRSRTPSLDGAKAFRDTVLPAGASQGASSPCSPRASCPPPRRSGQEAPPRHRLEAGCDALAGCQCYV